MITLFIFYLHTVAAVALFTKRWQEADVKEGLLGVGFLALIFSVGWSISAFIMQFLVAKEGFALWLDRDALSLVLLTVMETVFYYVQVRRKRKEIIPA